MPSVHLAHPMGKKKLLEVDLKPFLVVQVAHRVVPPGGGRPHHAVQPQYDPGRDGAVH